MAKYTPKKAREVSILVAQKPDTALTCHECSSKVPIPTIHQMTYSLQHYNSTKGYTSISVAHTHGCCHDHCKDAFHRSIENVPSIAEAEYHNSPLDMPAFLSVKCSLDSCKRRLTTDWFCIAPTYAAPGAQHLAGHAYWDLPSYGGMHCAWFCSLDHAVEGAHIITEQMSEGFEWEDNNNESPS